MAGKSAFLSVEHLENRQVLSTTVDVDTFLTIQEMMADEVILAVEEPVIPDDQSADRGDPTGNLPPEILPLELGLPLDNGYRNLATINLPPEFEPLPIDENGVPENEPPIGNDLGDDLIDDPVPDPGPSAVDRLRIPVNFAAAPEPAVQVLPPIVRMIVRRDAGPPAELSPMQASHSGAMGEVESLTPVAAASLAPQAYDLDTGASYQEMGWLSAWGVGLGALESDADQFVEQMQGLWSDLAGLTGALGLYPWVVGLGIAVVAYSYQIQQTRRNRESLAWAFAPHGA